MRAQVRIHLFTLFGGFFICYLVFLILWIRFYYFREFEKYLQLQYDRVLDKRMTESAWALSMIVYQSDKIGVDSVIRLTNVFKRLKAEVDQGYYVGTNLSIPNYKLYHNKFFTAGTDFGIVCQYNSTTPNYLLNPNGDTNEIQAIRVLNRYWTEAVNLNIGNAQSHKMSSIVIKSSSGVLCAYPGIDVSLVNPDRLAWEQRISVKNYTNPAYQILRN